MQALAMRETRSKLDKLPLVGVDDINGNIELFCRANGELRSFTVHLIADKLTIVLCDVFDKSYGSVA